MFTEADGTSINNQDRKELQTKKSAEIIKFSNFLKAPGKINAFKIVTQIFEAADLLTFS